MSVAPAVNNLHGGATERLTRAFLPQLRAAADGRVVFVSSGGGRLNLRRMSEAPRRRLLGAADDGGVEWSDLVAMADSFAAEYEAAAAAQPAAAEAAGDEAAASSTSAAAGDEALSPSSSPASSSSSPSAGPMLPFLSPSGYWLQARRAPVCVFPTPAQRVAPSDGPWAAAVPNPTVRALSLARSLSLSGLLAQSYGFSKACLGAYSQILARREVGKVVRWLGEW